VASINIFNVYLDDLCQSHTQILLVLSGSPALPPLTNHWAVL
jgi:hypothetical protein